MKRFIILLDSRFRGNDKKSELKDRKGAHIKEYKKEWFIDLG